MEKQFLQKYTNSTGIRLPNKRRSIPLTKILIAGVLALTIAVTNTSCEKFLDVVPDNTSEIKHAFKIRTEAEKYLYTCYSFLPKDGDGWFNAG
ncbi:MAG: hypothetical protein EOO88_49525, partial [Pedobacter sp.]